MYSLRVSVCTFLLVNGFLNILPSDCSSGDSRSCRPDVPLSDVIVMKYSNKNSVQACDIKARFVKVSRVPNNMKDNDLIHAVINKPRDVRKLMITFNGTLEGVSVHGSRATLLSCLEYQDTVLIRSAENRSCCIHVVLKLKYPAEDLGSMWVDKDGEVKGWQIKLQGNGTQHSKIKVKRSNADMSTNLKRKDSSGDMTDISECGKTRSCFRYHPTDSECGHLKCTYFLSYSSRHILETEYEFDFELSGQTAGWLAVGFSSDKQMMGDALVCKKNNFAADPTVQAYQIPMRHAHPTPKERFKSNLTMAVRRNGYMYCRFRVQSGQDGIMEMTNDWFQLYGRGPIASDGDLTKHEDTPLISDSKITLIKSVNKMNVYTSDGPPLMSVHFCSLRTIVVFLMAKLFQ